MIPTSPLYPDDFDSTSNLYRVHDSLRVKLLDDYTPGDSSIAVDGDITKFPPTGVITLTEQVSAIDLRAISFYYGSRSASTFNELEILPGFTDVAKPRRITNITQNVMAAHHNNLKDALIAIEEFIGVKGTLDTKPLGQTMEGRINFLRKLVLRPRAWFTTNKRIGIVPLTIEFDDLSFRNPDSWCWNFGDGTIPSNISCETISVSVISTVSNLIISNASDHSITKTYYTPGIYDVSLKVSNEFGEDTITIPKYIIARVAAPDEATIVFEPDNATQALISDVLFTRTNALVTVEVDDDGTQTEDPAEGFVWDMQDDLTHPDSPTTRGSYSVGGLYDIRLRVNTVLGAYRTTIFRNIVNVIERNNVWMMISSDTSSAITKDFAAYEFGIVSETFKSSSRTAQSITRDPTVVDTSPNATQKKFEWNRNNGFVSKNRTGSGDKGQAVVYWTESDSPSIHLRFKEYTGFTDTWSNPLLTTLDRGWNWVSFNSSSKIHFILGSKSPLPANTPGDSPTNQVKQTVSLTNYSVETSTFDITNYRNGAEELMQNTGNGTQGDYSVYRSCFKDHTGYLVRNDGVGSFFRLKSFYRTEGTLTEEFQYFRKLPDLPGSQKLEGQLVPLTNGVYFFNNSGEIAVWNDTSNVWSVGGPGLGSAPWRALQDQTQGSYDDQTNTMIATSDGDKRAYLSFDYSPNTFIKFNETSLTFSSLGARPTGEQLLMGVY